MQKKKYIIARKAKKSDALNHTNNSKMLVVKLWR